MNCLHCGQSRFADGRCLGCGAPEPKPAPAGDSSRAPAHGFAYMGHWVVIEEHPWGDDSVNWRWYLGPQLMAIVPVSRVLLEELFGRPGPTTAWNDQVMKRSEERRVGKECR